MRSQKEIDEKLARLLTVQQVHNPKPQKCPTCGQSTQMFDSWCMTDYPYLGGEIAALEWVLGLKEYLLEDHT